MKKTQEVITFKPKEVTKRLLSVLSDRAQDVVTKRYGLGKNSTRLTLEAIGSEYAITRERVRQIENFSLNAIKKSEAYQGVGGIISEIKDIMESHGGIVHEDEFLNAIATDKSSQNHIHFLLVLADAFTKLKEDDEFHHRWTTNTKIADQVENSLRKVSSSISDNDLVSENDLVGSLLKEVKDIADKAAMDNDILAKKWLRISKMLNQNPLGEWGLAKSPNIKMRGIRDYAYLVLRQHGSPMHFEEVAKGIQKLFGKNAHPATCHNELIKDERFVLVGRGLYALSEWGYSRGVVLDVIRAILDKDGPLTRDEVVSRVLKERHVKENTILVNLQNTIYFKKDSAGRYTLI
ncbi:MAG: sigma factor-like helix-turn-helix DNA-binding protein [Patescibacteria group bacterium]